MKQKPEDFITKYPLLFRNGMPKGGFEVGSGWFLLLNTLFPILEYHIISQVPIELQHDLYIVQIKEKFGGLRVYLYESTSFLNGAIDMAEDMSFNICEVCGNPGGRRNINKFYVRTVCSKHLKVVK